MGAMAGSSREALQEPCLAERFTDARGQCDVLGVAGGEALRGEDDERTLVFHALDLHGCWEAGSARPDDGGRYMIHPTHGPSGALLNKSVIGR